MNWCKWCGVALSRTNVHPSNKPSYRVCKTCACNRSWLLKVIRYSDYAAEYVARTEERERPEREKRHQAGKELAAAFSATAAQPQPVMVATLDVNERLARVERLLAALASDLGVEVGP